MIYSSPSKWLLGIDEPATAPLLGTVLIIDIHICHIVGAFREGYKLGHKAKLDCNTFCQPPRAPKILYSVLVNQ